MSRNPSGSEPHRFAIEELLDLYCPVVRSPSSPAPLAGKARKRVKEPNNEETTATKPRKRPKARVEGKQIRMIDARQEDQRSTSTRVIPALLHIQVEPGSAADEPPRRITVLLDHPAVKQLGWFSWLLVVVALTATQKVAAIPIRICLFAGLLVGFINALRWLFASKR